MAGEPILKKEIDFSKYEHVGYPKWSIRRLFLGLFLLGSGMGLSYFMMIKTSVYLDEVFVAFSLIIVSLLVIFSEIKYLLGANKCVPVIAFNQKGFVFENGNRSPMMLSYSWDEINDVGFSTFYKAPIFVTKPKSDSWPRNDFFRTNFFPKTSSFSKEELVEIAKKYLNKS